MEYCSNLRLDDSLMSGFLSTGDISAVLKYEGKQPSVKERFARFAMISERTGFKKRFLVERRE